MEIDSEPPHQSNNNGSLFSIPSASSVTSSSHYNVLSLHNSTRLPPSAITPRNSDGALSRAKSASFSHPGCALGEGHARGGLIADNLVHTADIFTDDDDEDHEFDLDDEEEEMGTFALEEDEFDVLDNSGPSMDVDPIILQPASKRVSMVSKTNAMSDTCVLRQIQFARSLVNFAKEVRKRQGGTNLPLETERLLQVHLAILLKLCLVMTKSTTRVLCFCSNQLACWPINHRPRPIAPFESFWTPPGEIAPRVSLTVPYLVRSSYLLYL